MQKYPRKVHELALQIDQPDLPNHIRRFLFNQRHPNDLFPTQDEDMSLSTFFEDKISVFHSAIATYYAPSDHSGIYGMHKQCIRSTPSWRQGPPRRDCVFIEKNENWVECEACMSHKFLFSYPSPPVVSPTPVLSFSGLSSLVMPLVVTQGCGWSSPKWRTTAHELLQ